nr:ATP-dependent helicase BRM-like [Tanacetum cinerariifolium]
MFDKSKLSRVDWKYIVIDEAQRMKDRHIICSDRPVGGSQLLPKVFDNRKVFHDWFSQPFQKEVSHNGEDDWLETEKKFIIIHRLHQILEPFMLRRCVEGSLPPKDMKTEYSRVIEDKLIISFH